LGKNLKLWGNHCLIIFPINILKLENFRVLHFISFVEPTTIDEAVGEADWILAMQDELNNFTRNQV
jgi:hypothetical protein